MDAATRERLLEAIRAMSEEYPDWRIGQIVANVATWARGPQPGVVWDVGDAEWIKAAEEHLEHKRQPPLREAVPS